MDSSTQILGPCTGKVITVHTPVHHHRVPDLRVTIHGFPSQHVSHTDGQRVYTNYEVVSGTRTVDILSSFFRLLYRILSSPKWGYRSTRYENNCRYLWYDWEVPETLGQTVKEVLSTVTVKRQVVFEELLVERSQWHVSKPSYLHGPYRFVSVMGRRDPKYEVVWCKHVNYWVVQYNLLLCVPKEVDLPCISLLSLLSGLLYRVMTTVKKQVVESFVVFYRSIKDVNKGERWPPRLFLVCSYVI